MKSLLSLLIGILTTLSLISIFSNAITVQAAPIVDPVPGGGYNCQWTGTSPVGPIPAIGRCDPVNVTCRPGFAVQLPSACEGRPFATCETGTFGCTPLPGGACVNVGQDCNIFPCCAGGTCTNLGGNIKICMGIPGGGGGLGTGTTNGPPLTGCQGGTGIDTAIGCIPILEEQGTANFFLQWGLGIAGGISLIMIAISAFMIMTSSGDPRRLQAGKELLTAAISGLLLIVFAAYLLKTIGVTILGIPGL